MTDPIPSTIKVGERVLLGDRRGTVLDVCRADVTVAFDDGEDVTLPLYSLRRVGAA